MFESLHCRKAASRRLEAKGPQTKEKCNEAADECRATIFADIIAASKELGDTEATRLPVESMNGKPYI